MPKRPVRSWVVIADAGRARVLETEGPDSELRPALPEGLVAPAVHGRSSDLKSDRPGRAYGSGRRRAAMEPHQDPHDVEKQRFARTVVNRLNDGADKGAFDRLVIVAPAKTLGELRAGLSKTTASKITGELAKDLTKMPTGKLKGHLGALLHRRAEA